MPAPRGRERRRRRLRASWELLSRDVQGERRGEGLAVDARLEEEAPLAGRRDEDAHAELARRLRGADDLRAAEDARAPARAARADVGVEVVERPAAEEDRVGERPVPGAEARGLA